MELIITTPNTINMIEDYNMLDMEDSKDREIKYLKFKNKQLEKENELLLSMLAEAVGRRTVVIREEVLERKPHFRIEENMSGDVLISCR